MYHNETGEKTVFSVRKSQGRSRMQVHEAAALREIRQLVLAAEQKETENGKASLERAIQHLEAFLQEIQKSRLQDDTQRALDSFRTQFETEYTWHNGFLRNVMRFGTCTAECIGKSLCQCPAARRHAAGRCPDGAASQLPGICLCVPGMS